MSTAEFVKGVVLAVVLAAVLLGLYVSFESYPITSAVISLAVLAAVLFWRFYLSIKVVAKNEVAIVLFFGEPQEDQVYPSGVVFIPWIPIKWDGHYPWDLARIPTRQLPFNFRRVGREEEQRIWSKDRQALLVDISGYVRFPYIEPESLCLMIKSGVPLEEKVLQEWMQDEVVSGLRDILAAYDHKQAIARSNLDAVRAAAQEFFLRATGLFAKSGICGNDAENFELGTGEVIIRVDTISPTKVLSDAMEAPVVAEYLADAAKKTAEVEKTLAGDPIRLAMADWVEGQRGKGESAADAKTRLIASGAYAKHELIVKDIILARSGNLQVARTELGSPDGTPLPSSLTYLSVGGGGGAGILFGGKSTKKGGKNIKDMDKKELQDEADKY